MPPFSHLHEGAVEHVREAPLPRRARDLQAEPLLHAGAGAVGHGAEQVSGPQAHLHQRLLGPDEEPLRQLRAVTQLGRRLEALDSHERGTEDELGRAPKQAQA